MGVTEDADEFHDRFLYILFYEFSSHRYSMEMDVLELTRLITSGNHQKALEKVSASSSTHADEDGNTLYHLAVLDLNTILLRWLIRHYQKLMPITIPNKGGKTCFHLACSLADLSPFMLICEECTSVSLTQWSKILDKNGHNPLQLACLGGNTEIVRRLISQLGLKSTDTKNTKLQTPLHSAAAGGHISCVRMLSKHKKLINRQDMFNATALHYAMLGGHVDVAKHLIGRCKAEVTSEAMNKMNILHAAVSSGDLPVVEYAFSKTLYKMHIAPTATGSTIIHIAAGIGSLSVLDYLLRQPHISSMINSTDNGGNTASHLAALRNRPQCLRLMIRKYSANIHMKNANGLTAYGILCNNETHEMRETFPILFEELDLLRKGSKRGSKSKRPQVKSKKDEHHQDTYSRIPSDVASKKERERVALNTISTPAASPLSGDGDQQDNNDDWLKIEQDNSGRLEVVLV